MGTLWQDLRFGARMLARNPGFTAVAVISLALGIGANTAIFSVVNAVLLRSLPYPNPERLVIVWETPPQHPEGRANTSVPNFLDWREQNEVFEDVGATHRTVPVNLTSSDTPERVDAQLVSAGLFPILGVPPLLGRNFLPDEEVFGAEPVVILSYGLWQRRFGGSPEVIGQTLPIDGESYTIVGVMPAAFHFLNDDAELWRPFRFSAAQRKSRTRYIRAAARLKEGLRIEQAQAQMDAVARRLEEAYPERNSGWGIRLESLHEALVGHYRPQLLVLLGAVGFVLLIACTNVANLLIAWAVGRQKEIAIRSALGAGRLRLIYQFLTESVMLGILGGALGLAFAYWGMRLLIVLDPGNLPRLGDISLDYRVLGFTLMITLFTGLLFGLAPALLGSKPDLTESLKEGRGGHAEGFAHQRVRSVLVVGEVSLALVLLIGAGLMINSFLRILRVDPGFDPDNLFTFQVTLPKAEYSESVGLGPGSRPYTLISPRTAQLYDHILERLRILPGVESAAAITWLPMNGYWYDGRSFTIEGRPRPGPGDRPMGAMYNPITPGFFRTMRIPLLRGRTFSESDSADAPWVVIVNQTMARRYWPDQDPLGQRLTLNIVEEERPREIVGVVPDLRHIRLNSVPNPAMYVPHVQQPAYYPGNRRRGRLHMSFVMKTALDPAGLVVPVQSAVAEMDRNQPIHDIQPMQAYVSGSVAYARFYTFLLIVFAGLALSLAAVGIYGVMSYSVSQRTHEFGIRMALGADRFNVLKLVLRKGLTLCLIGVSIGVPAAMGLTRLISSQLYDVKATDPATFVAVSLVVIGVALVACYIPARRATKVDPMVALRYE